MRKFVTNVYKAHKARINTYDDIPELPTTKGVRRDILQALHSITGKYIP